MRKLTPHQAEVFARLKRRATPSVTLQHDDGTEEVLQLRYVPLAQIGSRGALLHIVDKGYAEMREKRGPRGGELLEFRPITDTEEV